MVHTSDFPFDIMDVAHLLRLHVKRRSPGYAYADCPLCGDRRGKLCLNLTKNAWVSNCCGEKGGMLALYGKVHRVGNSEAYHDICDELQTGDFAPAYVPTTMPSGGSMLSSKVRVKENEIPQSPPASEHNVHQTLSAMLSMLSLTSLHRNHLRTVRGLSDEEIERYGFKSTPPYFLCRSLTEKLISMGCTVEGVPGFYKNENGEWTVNFNSMTAGILIPAVGIEGLIHGAQIRLDKPLKSPDDPPDKQGAKYIWLASSSKPYGVTSGSPVFFVGDPFARVVYVTEGGLKACVSHALTNRTFVATAGANNTAGLEAVFSVLCRNGTQEIIEAADMDKYRNTAVNQGASKIYLLAKKYGMGCRRLTWNPNYKGFDDWQLALRRKEKKVKEAQEMNFKQQFLLGLCDIRHIDACVNQWHQMPEDGVELADYLGLSKEEMAVFLRTPEQLEPLLMQQRQYQKFRIYQLDLEEGRTVPFAFCGIDKMREAGFEQPPAGEYRLIHDGKILRLPGQAQHVVLERIYEQYNDDLPQDYQGRSISMSDVVELYDAETRAYFYCDTVGFTQVRFSPMLVKPMRGDQSGEQEPREAESWEPDERTADTPSIDLEQLQKQVNALSGEIAVNAIQLSETAERSHRAEITLQLDREKKLDGTVIFQGQTHEEAYQSLVNAINQAVRTLSDSVRIKQLPLKDMESYQACRRCGGTRLYDLEFRTDYAKARKHDAVNPGSPELTDDDVPYYVSGTFCMDCQSFCETDQVLGSIQKNASVGDVKEDGNG